MLVHLKLRNRSRTGARRSQGAYSRNRMRSAVCFPRGNSALNWAMQARAGQGLCLAHPPPPSWTYNNNTPVVLAEQAGLELRLTRSWPISISLG